ncbi:MAG: site-specific DNA-methyltransferase [Rhodospirillaceae bacterium]|nr:site-specific DNA-methyltransferase [Rhodospirillaceae bacterium]
MARKPKKPKEVRTLTHEAARRKNIPTAEYQSVMRDEEKSPVRVAYERRNRDLDPQLVWRGKDEQDESDLIVQAPPLYIQEKVHPKVLVDDLLRQTKERRDEAAPEAPDLFADFNGLPDEEARTEFYQHDANWSNRMILGDSLQVMASLAEREGLRGKVQCLYIDPPYGIKFNSNFQWSTTNRDVKDKAAHLTREPEQVKAFRDTWRDGIHSYLNYLRDRLTVARDLLTESGSVFVQIGDENVHRVRALMDEVFGEENFLSEITFRVTANLVAGTLGRDSDYILWYARKQNAVKYRQLFRLRTLEDDIGGRYSRVQLLDWSRMPVSVTDKTLADLVKGGHAIYRHDNITSQGATPSGTVKFEHRKQNFHPGQARHWTTTEQGLSRLSRADRLGIPSKNSLAYVRFFTDFSVAEHTAVWRDTQTGAFTDQKVFVVQTNAKVLQRCILMATDPGDLVLDPTCGSGTTAYVAEQWGRRWITIDTSRVALALARARIMGARYPWYLLADSPEGQRKEAEITERPPSEAPTHGDIRQGFVYERVPHITLKSIANNAEIDEIWEEWQKTLEPLRKELNDALGKSWEEWEIPREADDDWPAEAGDIHAAWWKARIARQKQMDASIAAKADHEYLFDKPYEDKSRIRVAGPFTVESLSPHRVLAVDQDDELVDTLDAAEGKRAAPERSPDETAFAEIVLENLRTAGVQQAYKEDKIDFSSIEGWPGRYICAVGRYEEGDRQQRAGILIGPEFGTVSRPDLVAATREAGDAGFDVLVACAFNFDAHSADFDRLGSVPVLKARMNADLHMAGDLKNTGKGNLFVIFGEPDIEILDAGDDEIAVKIHGVDVFVPNTGEVRSNDPDEIACWFIDTDYNEESFFVRHAYFLGAGDPYKSLKTTLKAEIDPDAWATLNSDTSRPFPRPASGRIAVKVINHLGDEVMKVFGV